MVPPMLLPGAKGELAVKNGKKIFINLHEPKFIREIMDYLLHGVVDFHTKQKWVFDPGEELLNTLGYSFKKQKTLI